MKHSLYAWCLAVVLFLGVAFSVGMILYTVDAYEHSSIVHYIGSERW